MRIEKPLKTYLKLSTAIYAIDKAEAPEQELRFYMDYAKEAKGSILEPMCGTGRFLIPMIETGLEVDGFDASPYMLEVLHEKCLQKGLKAQVWEGFLQNLNIEKSYRLIFIPDASLNLILNTEEIKACLKKIYDHLERGGKFVFELVTLKYAEGIEVGAQQRFAVRKADGKSIIQNVLILPFEDQIGKTSSRYELIEDGEILKTELEDFALFFHNPDEMNLWLTEIGYMDIKRLKAFDRNEEASKNDGVIVFECTKG